MSTVAELDISQNDLDSDKVHLNETGRRKFYEKLVLDLKIAKEEVDKFLAEGMEWDDLTRLSQKTPKTAKKRKRTEQEDETGSIKKKKDQENELVLDTLKSFMAEIREDRKLANLQSSQIDKKITNLKKSRIKHRNKARNQKHQGKPKPRQHLQCNSEGRS